MPSHPTESLADFPSAIAYSYIRFSSLEQFRGDSLRRQMQAAADWCKLNGVPLDTSTTLHDLGKSAFLGDHRQNPDRHALAAFLKLVESGKVPRGSFLLIENLDRLSREEEVPACHLLTGILMAGVRVVQLSPYEMLLTDKSNGWELMRAVMELSRGHGESAIKSERVGKAWREKKRRARAGELQKTTDRVAEGQKAMTKQVPKWLEVRGGKLQPIPERAAIVKRIFHLARTRGSVLIARQFQNEGVPPMGLADHWNASYIREILLDRRAVGEHQPRYRRTRKPDGDPIKNYFPAVVTEEEWLAAREGANQRMNNPGRTGTRMVNVFAGLLRNAAGTDSYQATRFQSAKSRRSGSGETLVNTGAREGRAKCRTFPFRTFEWAILSELREIDPHEILNGDHGPDESAVLAGELTRVEESIVNIVADMEAHGESPVLFARLRDKEARKKELVELLTQARQKAVYPLSEAWGEVQTLAEILETTPDRRDTELRLRAVLRRVVESIWLLVVPRGPDRLCAVQVWFAGGQRQRSYLILHRPPRSNGKATKPGGRWVRSFATAALADGFDLRSPSDAKKLEALLTSLDLD